MNEWQNLLRAYRFQRPEWIPIHVNINASNWKHRGPETEELVLRHPRLFPNHHKGSIDFDNPPVSPWQRAGVPYKDPWGCVWQTSVDGITGVVTKHPLADWDAFDDWRPPDPATTASRGGVMDWEKAQARFERAKKEGGPLQAGLTHGHTFLLLQDLRGYENLMFDMMEEHPNLPRLIQIVEDYNMFFVKRYVEFGAEVMSYPEDLGAQSSPMISPDLFRKYIKPSYQRLMAPAREAGCAIHMHSDGHIWDLLDDIIEGGVTVINLQDLVHGIDEIAKRLKGRMCVDLDIDRQRVTPYGSPKDIDDLIREEVMKLGDPEGGLCLMFGLYLETPLENADAVFTAMEKYSTFYS